MIRVLLVDAVEAPAGSAAASLGSVEQWFGKHLAQNRDLEVQTLPASSRDLKEAASAASGVIISGSSRDAWSDDPDILRLLHFAREMVAGPQPVLGVCFGHQLLGRALGAEVGRSPAGWEVGAAAVKLTANGKDSPLFAGFAPEFTAIQSHRDAVLTLPDGAKVLAANAAASVQAFSLEDHVFGVQFHPEMDGAILRHRWAERREKLRGKVGFDLDHALDSAEADASRVLHNFAAMLR